MQQLDTPWSSAASKPLFHQLGRSLISVVAVSVVLAGCASRPEPAPIVDGSQALPPPSTSVSAKGSYTVQPGDTLYQIAQRHNTTVRSLIELNNLSDPGQLVVGQTLALDTSSTSVATPSKPKASGGITPAPLTPATPAEPSNEDTGVKAPADTPATTSSPKASDASLVNWAWPANGKVIQGFTEQTKGIDIAGDIGDPVKAAAAGKVMYAGNGVRGLGNLVLVGHSNGFITAYAHNDSISVKTGDEVTQGHAIATLGQSDTHSPRLHFEIRRRGTPVNPMSYLPNR